MQQKTPTKRELAAALSRAREATLRLVEPVDDEQMVAQVSPIMSPLVWDLAHIAWFEELWLVQRVGGDESSDERLDDVRRLLVVEGPRLRVCAEREWAGRNEYFVGPGWR